MLCAIVQFVLYDVKKESVYMVKQITKRVGKGYKTAAFRQNVKKKNT